MAGEITPAAVLYIAHLSRASDGIRWYEQGLQISYKDAGGCVLGEVKEPGGSTYKVWVGMVNGHLSYECEDCFSPGELPDYEESLDDEPESRLCVHGAAVAIAAAENNFSWASSPTVCGLDEAANLCPGSGEKGRLDFERAVGDEWYVICHVCGTTWAGGSQILDPHQTRWA